MGLLAGYYGGKLDAVTMRMADIFFSFSTTLMAILLLGLFRKRGVLIVILAICIADWVKYARTMRGSVLEVKEEAYVMAAKATGAGDFRLLLKPLPHDSDNIGDAQPHQTEYGNHETEQIDEITEVGDPPESTPYERPNNEEEHIENGKKKKSVKGPPRKIFDLFKKRPA